jgi:octaprenyl-diphosphate synthase
VIDTVVKAGGISYAEKKMHEYRDAAIAVLHQFPDTEVRQTLEKLVHYTTDRKY